MSLPLVKYSLAAYYIIATAEASSNLSRFDGVKYGLSVRENVKDLENLYLETRSAGFGDEVKRRIMLGTFVLSTGYYDAYYSKAQKIRRLLVQKMDNIFKEYDAIIMPTSPQTAFSIGQNDKDPIAMYLADIYTVLANLTGVPAISLPLFSHSNNMPFGLQIITNKTDELTLLEISEGLLNRYAAEVDLIEK